MQGKYPVSIYHSLVQQWETPSGYSVASFKVESFINKDAGFDLFVFFQFKCWSLLNIDDSRF